MTAESPDAKNNTGAEGTNEDRDAQGTLLTADKSAEKKPADAKPDDKKADDAKPDDKKPDDKKPDDKKADEKAKLENAPEKYEPFSAPDGVTLDQELVGEFSTAAKELNLSQEKAQKLVDFGPKIMQRFVEAQSKQWGEIREGWVNDLKADKEFGGEKLNETVQRAKRALSKFGDEKLVKLLLPPSKGGTGFGDNDALIRLLAKVDKATSEDSIVDGEKSGKDDRSAADLLYPNQGKAK